MNTLKFDISPARVIQDKSQEFRWLVKKDGTKTLQIACYWNQGTNGGIEWRDIPEIKEITE